MTARPRSAAVSTTSNGGVFVRITLADLQGRVFINLLVWNGSFTSADELCNSQTFLRGSVRFWKISFWQSFDKSFLGAFDSY